jgi:hypothetical protein
MVRQLGCRRRNRVSILYFQVADQMLLTQDEFVQRYEHLIEYCCYLSVQCSPRQY